MARLRITPQERAAALTAALETLKVITRILEVDADHEETKRAPRQQERQERRDRRIVRLWDDLPPKNRLTREKIAKLLSLGEDNGWLADHLTSMVSRGLLCNDFKKTGIAGYYLPATE